MPIPENGPTRGQAGSEPSSLPTLFGRSSSHFTRVARIVAAELGVPYTFRVVPDLLSTDAGEYGGNPALRLPVLHTDEGAWFGALNICRVLQRCPNASLRARVRVVWPEDLRDPHTANAQELTVQAMASEVALIMARLAKADETAAHLVKQRESLVSMLRWLEANVGRVLDALPDALPDERSVSFLEVTLFCLVQHLEFRDIVPVAPYHALGDFCRRFGERESARKTPFRFD